MASISRIATITTWTATKEDVASESEKNDLSKMYLFRERIDGAFEMDGNILILTDIALCQANIVFLLPLPS
jgi:hypothetical protein